MKLLALLVVVGALGAGSARAATPVHFCNINAWRNGGLFRVQVSYTTCSEARRLYEAWNERIRKVPQGWRCLTWSVQPEGSETICVWLKQTGIWVHYWED